MIINYTKNPSVLNKFLEYLLGVRGFSTYTVRNYNYELLLFFYFINKYKDFNIDIKQFNTFILLGVTKSDIIAFLVYCNFTRENTAITRQCKLAAIRTFYKWLLSTIPGGYLRINPAMEIPNIEKIERIPRHLSLEQAKKIQEIFNIENSRFPVRNNAIISTFLSTGARASELINANLKDLNLKLGTLTVIGKGNKERVLYLNNICKMKIEKYLKQRNKKKNLISLNEPLFLNKNGFRIGIDGIEDICNNAFKLMGMGNYGYSTHTLRHTAASIIYIYVSQDLVLLKQFLGHDSITSTQIYTHIYNKQIKEAFDRNPLNNLEENNNREEEVA